MNIISIFLNRNFVNHGRFVALCLLIGGLPLAAQDLAEAPASEADKAWAETEQALKPPVPPAEWRERRPSREEIEQFREQQGKLAGVAAERARAFYEKYPDHEKAAEAHDRELRMIQIAAQLGNTNVNARLAEMEQAKLDDPNLSEDERFELRASAMQRKAMTAGSEDRDAVMAAYEKGARDLIKEFPSRAEPYKMLLSLASGADADKAKAIAQEVLESAAPDGAKESAQGLLRKFDSLGKPVDIEFTAIDGREVDLAAMKGKVVLVDFWATWCGPCVAELPNVKAAYNKLHPKGFEIVGISFDKDQEKLEAFVEKEDIPWPQYFDGKFWDNDFGRQYGISSIPTMWLVDKQGNLIDMEARNNLQAKVEKLLAE